MPDQNTNLKADTEMSEDQRLRWRFFQNILSTVPQSPELDLQTICRIWLDATGAESVWLWLLHDDSMQQAWEVTAAAGRGENASQYLPSDPIPEKGRASVIDYCNALGRSVFVTDLQTWQHELNGRTYRVFADESFKRMGCHAILFVPLGLQRDLRGVESESAFTKLRGVISAHFGQGTPQTPLQSSESYALMGLATSQALAASFAAEQHRILFKLESLATRFTSTDTRQLNKQRAQYLQEVINVIREHLRVEYSSVFYRTRDPGQIECIATTGLYNKDGKLAAERLAEARYRTDEALTGHVFATGEPAIVAIGTAPPNHRHKWGEIPMDDSDSHLPWVCYPIKVTEGANTRALGVIRCVGNQSLLAKGIRRNFDPIQVQSLDFIARQLAPILETMAANIERERSISVIKHDLFAPLRMIETQTEILARCVVESKPFPIYSISNVKAALLLAKNLAGALTEQQSFNPEPTYIEGEIVARLKEGLTHFARAENQMSIEFQNVRENLPRLNIDRGLVEVALTNLLLNAIKYGYRSTSISVYAESTEDGYVLNVSNYGMGVEDDEVERIFEGQYRSPLVIPLKVGSGLGLKIARAAMRRHGGDLRILSKKNPTTFAMFFPKTLSSAAHFRSSRH